MAGVQEAMALVGNKIGPSAFQQVFKPQECIGLPTCLYISGKSFLLQKGSLLIVAQTSF